MTILFVLLAILLLGLLITAHELGHYLSARALKIAVKEFSVGFGPKLWQRQGKRTETLYSLRAVPLGGYCAFYDEDAETLPPDDPRRYAAAAVWKRMIVVVAGAAMNILLAFVLAVALHLLYGAVAVQPNILEVTPGSPAAEAGLKPGDVMLEVNGQAVAPGDAGSLSTVVDTLADGEAVTLLLSRGGGEMTLSIVPQYDATEGRKLIGVSIQGYVRPNFFQAVGGAFDSCVYASTVILKSLGQLIFHGEGVQDISGPVGVVQIVAEQTKSGGLYMYLNLAILISINLGLFNLLPIPGLDGSRFLFLAAEAVRRKPVNRRVEGTIHMVGFVLLFGLLILFTFRDIVRIVGG
jgi:regulator of sigma E protease